MKRITSIFIFLSLIISSATISSCQEQEQSSNDPINIDIVSSIQSIFNQQDWNYEIIQTDDASSHFIVRLAGKNEKMTIHVVVDPRIYHYIVIGIPVDVAPISSENFSQVLTALNEFNLTSQCVFASLGSRGDLIFSCGAYTEGNAFSPESFLTHFFAVTKAIDTETSTLTHCTNLE